MNSPTVRAESSEVLPKSRRLARVDLSRFEPPALPDNRSAMWRIAWYLVNALLFQSPVVLPSGWKASLLRMFGARVGRGAVIKPRVTLKFPWFLELGDHVWLGEGVWIDNHTTVRIGSHVCISQGAYLFTGNHDYEDERFAFFCKGIEVEEGVWIGARVTVCPGSHLRRMSVLGAGVIWRGETEPQAIYCVPTRTLDRAALRHSA